jgi:hypothetical protein
MTGFIIFFDILFQTKRIYGHAHALHKFPWGYFCPFLTNLVAQFPSNPLPAPFLPPVFVPSVFSLPPGIPETPEFVVVVGGGGEDDAVFKACGSGDVFPKLLPCSSFVGGDGAGFEVCGFAAAFPEPFSSLSWFVSG